MPQQTYEQSQPHKAEWHTVHRTNSGKGELALTASLCIFVVVGLIYAASLIAWGEAALAWWKAAAIAAIGGPAIPFVILIWRAIDLIHVAVDREVAEHLGIIHDVNQTYAEREMQLEQMRRQALPIPTSWATRKPPNSEPTLVLPNGETIRARIMAAWAGRGDLRIESARLNDVGRATWEGMCTWLSQNGLATPTSQGVTGKLTSPAEVVRARVFAAAMEEGTAEEAAEEIKERMKAEG